MSLFRAFLLAAIVPLALMFVLDFATYEQQDARSSVTVSLDGVTFNGPVGETEVDQVNKGMAEAIERSALKHIFLLGKIGLVVLITLLLMAGAVPTHKPRGHVGLSWFILVSLGFVSVGVLGAGKFVHLIMQDAAGSRIQVDWTFHVGLIMPILAFALVLTSLMLTRRIPQDGPVKAVARDAKDEDEAKASEDSSANTEDIVER